MANKLEISELDFDGIKTSLKTFLSNKMNLLIMILKDQVCLDY